MSSVLKPLVLGLSVIAGAASVAGGARAQGLSGAYYETGGYGGSATYGRAYGYGDAAIRGDYVGAPFTRIARPSELVPSAWGYGTYGIPTIAGIRQAPVGTPTVYVIDGPPQVARRERPTRSRVLSRGRDGRWMPAQNQGSVAPSAAPSGARIVTVTVPRRYTAER